MWDLPRPGLEPVSPALTGRFSTTAPPGKPCWKIFFLNLFIYLFMAVLSLHFCSRAFSSCARRGPLLIAVCGPLTVAASLIAGHRLQTRRLSNCGSWAQLSRGMWDLPRPGLKPVSPALAGRFSTTAPPGKPCWKIFNHRFNFITCDWSVHIFYFFLVQSWKVTPF